MATSNGAKSATATTVGMSMGEGWRGRGMAWATVGGELAHNNQLFNDDDNSST